MKVTLCWSLFWFGEGTTIQLDASECQCCLLDSKGLTVKCFAKQELLTDYCSEKEMAKLILLNFIIKSCNKAITRESDMDKYDHGAQMKSVSVQGSRTEERTRHRVEAAALVYSGCVVEAMSYNRSKA